MSSSLARANFGGPSSNVINSGSGTAGGRLTQVRTFCLFGRKALKLGATVGLAPPPTPPDLIAPDDEIVSD